MAIFSESTLILCRIKVLDSYSYKYARCKISIESVSLSRYSLLLLWGSICTSWFMSNKPEDKELYKQPHGVSVHIQNKRLYYFQHEATYNTYRKQPRGYFLVWRDFDVNMILTPTLYPAGINYNSFYHLSYCCLRSDKLLTNR